MRLLFTFFILLTYSSIFSQNTWELKKNKNNIKVYTKTTEGYSLKATKVTSVLETTISRLVAVLMDADNFYKVVPTSKSSKLLKKISDFERIYYIQTDAPWPVSDRDGIYSFKFSQDPISKAINVKIGCLPDFIPKKEDYVRVPRSVGSWKFTPLNNGKVEVFYQNVTDPGGSIPAWLANSSAVSIPYETITNLKERVAMKQYEGQSFSFLKK